MKVKVIAFDFDGVFVRDSDAVFKKEAWGNVLAPYKGKYEVVLNEASQLFGSGKAGGRAEMFHYIFEKLEGIQYDRDLFQTSLEKFDDYVQTKILEAGLVPGVVETVEILTRHGIHLYLNSGTTTSALQTTVKNLNLDSFFRGILGSTLEPYGGSKIENLRFIMQCENILAGELIMVGDSWFDYVAAKEVGSLFVGFSNKWNRWSRGKQEFLVVRKFEELCFLIDNFSKSI